jgi:hypothetical protein
MLDTDSVTSIKIVDGTIEGADIAANLDLSDSQKIRFGAGNDLQIYHDGSNSYINDSGTGALRYLSNTHYFANAALSEIQAQFVQNGEVSLYYDNSKKLETTSYGAAITSSGSSHGLKVFHSNGNEVASLTHGGSGDEGALILRDSNTATVAIRGEVGQDIDITTGGNFDLEHDSTKLRLGAGNDLEIYHDGTDSYIQNTTGVLRINNDGTDLVISTDNNIHIRTNGTEEAVKAIANGAVELYYDNSKKFETRTGGVTITGSSYITGNDDHPDNSKARFGTSDDLQIYHSGSQSLITHGGTGQLIIQGNDNDQVKIMKGSSEEGIVLNNNGNVELYYNNSKKFETLSTGTRTSGNVQLPFVDANNGLRNKIQWVSQANFFDEVAYIAADRTATSGAVSDLVFANGSVNAVSEKMRLLSFGGLTFGGDTAAANALDDYEEGTFTPTINGSLSGGIRQGFYVKVGQLVMVTMMIKWTANSGAGGGVGIGGFPFASTNTGSTYHRAGASWGFTQGLDNQGNKQLTFNINANVTAGGIHVINDNASAGAIGAQDCSSSGEIQLTVNYRST